MRQTAAAWVRCTLPQSFMHPPINCTKGGLITIVAHKSGNVQYVVDRRAATINYDCSNSACCSQLQAVLSLIGRTLEEYFGSFVAVAITFISYVHIYFETVCEEAREVYLRAILTGDDSIIVALDATELEIGKTQR